MSVSRRAATSAFQQMARRAQSSDNKAPEKVTSSYLAHKYPRPLTTKQFGVDILHDPLWNKGLSFDHSERDRLGIRGLLPPAVRSLEDQVQRSMRRLKAMGDNNVQQNLYLQELHNRNETLYHRVIIEDVEMIAPLIYTPTVGAVCEKFGNQFRRSRGMYFSQEDRGHFGTMVHNWPHDDVHVIVVTDGSRILGLGDLGAHGMGIPIGKLALYCAAGGIAPHRVLPVMLDVGTNNKALLEDDEYVGVRRPRLEGDEYFDMVDEFMAAVFARWPGVVVQFEDFETSKAVPLLAKYRNIYRVFNDDIQGTGCVALSGLMSAARNSGSKLTDMRVLCAGAGSAGLGVCAQLVDGMVEAGLSRSEALSRFLVCTHLGALGAADGQHGDPNHKGGMYTEHVKPFMNPTVSDGTSLVDCAKQFKPTVLLGMTAHAKVFTEELVRTMAANCPRPIIMPMSNPTAKAECSAEEAYRWTDGKAIVATGSPFPPVTFPDGRVFRPSQCNNMYVFPGIGLAASVAGVTRITDRMMYRAAAACTDSMNAEEIAEGRTFPHIKRIREVAHQVAVAVIDEALKGGLAPKISNKDLSEGISTLVARKMYYPNYVSLVGPRHG